MALPRAQFDITARDRTRQGFQSATGRMRQLARTATRVAGALGLVVGAGGLAMMVRRQLEVNDSAAKMADSLEISTEAMMGLYRASRLNGVENAALETGFRTMTQGIARYAEGSGAARDALHALGFTQRDLLGIPADQQFARIADELNKVEDVTIRNNMALEIFGRQGMALVNVTRLGTDGLRRVREQAEYFGTAISGSNAGKITDFNDAMLDLGDAGRGVANILAIELAGASSSMVRGFAYELPIATMRSVQAFDQASMALTRLQLAGRSMMQVQDEMALRLANRVPLLGRQMADSLRETIRDRAGNIMDLGDAYIETADRIEERDARIAEMIKKRDAFLADPPSRAPAAPVDPMERPDRTRDTEADREREERERERLRRSLMAFRDTQLQEEELLRLTLHRREVMIEEGLMEQAITEDEHQELRVMAFEDYQTRMTEIAERQAEERSEIERRHQEQVTRYQQQAMMAGIGFLQAMGQHGKAFAVAAIAIQAGLAAKKILIESKVAAMAALTPPPVGLGPVAGQALSAKIIAAGRMAAGFTVATGLANIAGQAGGQSTGARPVFEADPITSLPRDSQQTFSRGDEPMPAPNVNITVNSLDPKDAAEVIRQNRGVIISTVQEAYHSRGKSGPLD